MTDTASTDQVQEALDREFPEAWKPEKKGDQIVGTFLRVEQGTTNFGPAIIVILAEEDGTERAIWLFAEALRSGFLRAKPMPGERIGVRYLGKTKAKNPTPGKSAEYHNYKVAVDRPVQGRNVDWATELASVGTPTEVVAPDDDDDLDF